VRLYAHVELCLKLCVFITYLRRSSPVTHPSRRRMRQAVRIVSNCVRNYQLNVSAARLCSKPRLTCNVVSSLTYNGRPLMRTFTCEHCWTHVITRRVMTTHKARFILVQNVASVDVASSIEHSNFCVEGTRCSAVLHAGRGVWLCVCVVSGVKAESLLFLPVTANNSKQRQPRWSSCICSWSSSILKNKCLNCKC